MLSFNHARTGYPRIHIICDDITQLKVDGFVYYAQPSLQLGSGLGGMIRRRGGPDIQKQLNEMAPRRVTEAVLTAGGRLCAGFIVHAVGPPLGEPEAQEKLRKAMLNALDLCETRGARRIAIPPMGTGFYGIPVETCAATMKAAFDEFFSKARAIAEIVICCRDPWVLPLFSKQLGAAATEGGDA